jgi:hypothetical protein
MYPNPQDALRDFAKCKLDCSTMSGKLDQSTRQFDYVFSIHTRKAITHIISLSVPGG